MAIKANLVVDQGANFTATIDVADANDTVFNLTGYNVAAQMRKNYTSSTAITFTASHTGVLGKINLGLSANTTAAIEPGRYLYDVEITSSGGTITRVVEGIVTVTPGITRI
jgi:hypothetical protein